jgi:hypothetical protein
MTAHDEFRNITAFIGIMWVGIVCGALLVDYICDNCCAAEGEEKIETRPPQKRKRARTNHTLATKMPSKYYAIYNVSRGVWAVRRSNVAETIWAANDWAEGEALVGFWYDEEDNNAHDIIYCPDGHIIYVAGDIGGAEYEYHLEESTYVAPPAILVNLENQFDAKFLRRKGEPSWWGHGSASDCESESDDDDESEEELPAKKRARLSPQPSTPAGNRRILAAVAANQPIVDFLYRCHDATTNTFKRKAYARVIAIIGSYWADDLTELSEYDLPRVLPQLSENMIRKIREFLDGVPEEDIINS